MSDVDVAALKRLVGEIGRLRGWDFGRVRLGRGPVPWDYSEVVKRVLTPTDRVLDVGTGGGEVFPSLAPAFREGIGVNISPVMAATADENALARMIGTVTFQVMATHDPPLDEAAFDIVLNRHAGVFAGQVVRVLSPGGYFITQQVAGRNAQSIYSAFGWGSTGA